MPYLNQDQMEQVKDAFRRIMSPLQCHVFTNNPGYKGTSDILIWSESRLSLAEPTHRKTGARVSFHVPGRMAYLFPQYAIARVEGIYPWDSGNKIPRHTLLSYLVLPIE